MVVPCASGSLLTKVWKSFKEAATIGLIDDVRTKVFAAQAAGCSPIVTAIRKGTEIILPVKPDTLAKSLAIGNPADGYYAWRVARETGGGGEDASDLEMIEAIKLLAATEGVFAETAGGVTLAAAKKLVESGRIERDASTVVCITGNGLKTQEALAGHTAAVHRIKPNMAAFEDLLKGIGR